MKSIKYIAILVSVLLAASSFASEVKNVELTYQAGQTVAAITVNGPVRYTHQTEVAKDGKPFRVIVDVLAATHDLGAKIFRQVPDCAVTALRTSQYSVSPEKVVRLVFDMREEIVYQISSDNEHIYVRFPDKQTKSFASWSTQSVVDALKAAVSGGAFAFNEDEPSEDMSTDSPSKTTGELNASIERDRQESLASNANTLGGEKSVTKPSVLSQPVIKPMAGAIASNDELGPEIEDVSPQSIDRQTPPVNESVKAVEQKSSPVKPVNASMRPDIPKVDSEQTSNPESETPISTPKHEEKALTKAEVGKDTPPVFENKKPVLADKSEPTPVKTAVKSDRKQDSPAVSSTSKNEPTGSKTKVEKPASEKSEVKTASKSVDTKTTKKEKSADKKVASAEEDNSTIKSTSRFRRSARDKKIQGTMVAEFPKRLVIKYKARSRRDPFETLVNETKVDNSPTEKRIPNVEGIKLVGVLESEGAKNQALFEDKQGYGYILKSGDKVQKGYVLRVETTRVYFQIFEYGWSRTVALNLEEN